MTQLGWRLTAGTLQILSAPAALQWVSRMSTSFHTIFSPQFTSSCLQNCHISFLPLCWSASLQMLSHQPFPVSPVTLMFFSIYLLIRVQRWAERFFRSFEADLQSSATCRNLWRSGCTAGRLVSSTETDPLIAFWSDWSEKRTLIPIRTGREKLLVVVLTWPPTVNDATESSTRRYSRIIGGRNLQGCISLFTRPNMLSSLPPLKHIHPNSQRADWEWASQRHRKNEIELPLL